MEIDLAELASVSDVGDFAERASRLFQSLYRLERRLKVNAHDDAVLIKNGEWASFDLVWGLMEKAQGNECDSDWVEGFRPFFSDLYRQFRENYPVSHPDNIAVLRGMAPDGKNHGSEKPYSMSSFVQLALSQLIVPKSTRFYLFHFGPARQAETSDQGTGDVGTGTLALNTYLRQAPYQLPEGIWNGITALLDGAIASVGRWEAAQLSRLHEQRRLSYALAATAYGVGHELKDPHSLARNALSRLATALATAENEIPKPELLKKCHAARLLVEWAADLSSNMNLLGALFGINGDCGQLDSKFFSEQNQPYPVVGRLAKIGRLINEAWDSTQGNAWMPIEIEGLDNPRIKRLVVAETIATQEGERRLGDAFFDSIFFEIIFNAARRMAQRITVAYENVVFRAEKETRRCVIFQNEADEQDFSDMTYPTEEYEPWPTSGESHPGGYRHIATKLAVSRQGGLAAKRFTSNGKHYFAVALNLEPLRESREEDTHDA